MLKPINFPRWIDEEPAPAQTACRQPADLARYGHDSDGGGRAQTSARIFTMIHMKSISTSFGAAPIC